jgi:hypothetical protein
MLKREAASIRRYFDINWNIRDMLRFFYRCAEDASLASRGNTSKSGRSYSSMKHHRLGIPKREAAKFLESDHLDPSERMHPFSFNRLVPTLA